MQKDGLLIDQIIYLASLASSSAVIDPMLDRLRSVTVSWDRTSPLKKQDRDSLQQLLEDLKSYLINDDPLRDFTAQTLDQRLQNLGQTHSRMSKFAMQFYGTIVVGIGIAGINFIVSSKSVRLLLAIPLFLLTVALGTIWFYASALQNFKMEFRKAFLYLCLGVVWIGIEFVHFTMVQLLHIGDKPLFKYGGFNLLATISFVFMYLGLRSYAMLVGITSRWIRLPTLVLALLGIGLIAILQPHTTVPEPAFFDFAIASDSMILVLSFFNFRLADGIVAKVTTGYATSMRTLRTCMIFTCLASVIYCSVLPRIGVLSGQSSSILVGAATTVPMLILLYSGYSFKKGTTTERDNW